MSLIRLGFIAGSAALSYKFLKPETKTVLKRKVSAGLRAVANAIDPSYKAPMWSEDTKKKPNVVSKQQEEIEQISVEIESILDEEDDGIPSTEERTFRGFRIVH
jgi:hypothetical protein